MQVSPQANTLLRIRLVLFWLALIVIADIGLGHFLVPVVVRWQAHLDIKEYLKTSCLHPYYNHGFKPGTSGLRQYGDSAYPVYTNSLSMLDNRCRIVTNDGRKKVLFIGDSYTEGVGYSYDKTFVGIIQSKIDTSRIDILNAGVASFSPKLYFLRVKYLLEQEKVKPDEIFCLVDYSDYGDELVYEDFKPSLNLLYFRLISFLRLNSTLYNVYHFAARKYFLHKSGIPEGAGESFIYWIKTNNDFLDRYPDFYKIRQDWGMPEYRNNTTLKKARELAESNMDSLNHLCLKNNIRLHVSAYPRSAFLTVDTIYGCYPNRLWQNYCDKRSIDFISLYPAFITTDTAQNRINAQKYFITGDSHWNEAGHMLVAEKLLPYIHP